MKRVTTVKRGLLNLLIGIIGLAFIIFMGWFLANHAENNFYYTLTPDHRVRNKGMIMMIVGVIFIYGVIFSNIIEIITRNRVVDVPEYARLLEGVFEDKGSCKLRRQMKKALLCYDRTRFKKALKRLDVLLSQCRNDREKCSIYTLMGMCYADSKQHVKAVEAYTAAVEVDGANPSLWEKLGWQQYKAGMYPQAVESWKCEIQLDSDDARPYVDIANAYLNEKNYDGAVEYAGKAAEINENFGEAYRVLCLAYQALGDKENCRANYNFCRVHGGGIHALTDVKVWLEENE